MKVLVELTATEIDDDNGGYGFNHHEVGSLVVTEVESPKIGDIVTFLTEHDTAGYDGHVYSKDTGKIVYIHNDNRPHLYQ